VVAVFGKKEKMQKKGSIKIESQFTMETMFITKQLSQLDSFFFYFLILLFKNKINFIKINENRFNHYFKI